MPSNKQIGVCCKADKSIFWLSRNYWFKIVLYLVLLTFLLRPTYQANIAGIQVQPASNIINITTTYEFVYDRKNTNGAGEIRPFLPLSQTSIVTVTFPSQYSFSWQDVNCQTQIGSQDFTSGNCVLDGYTITVNEAFMGQANLLIQKFTLRVLNITNPSPAIATGFFNGEIGDDTTVPSLSSNVKLQPAVFQNCFITFQPANLSSNADMVISFKLKNALTTASSIKVVFPDNTWSNKIGQQFLPISNSMQCSNNSQVFYSLNQNVSPHLNCRGINNQEINISNLLLGDLSSSEELSLIVNSFQSPPSPQPSDKIKITSFTNGFAVDTCQCYVSNLVPNYIPGISISNSANNQKIVVNKRFGLVINFENANHLSPNDEVYFRFPKGAINGALNINDNSMPFYSNLLNFIGSYSEFTANQIVKFNVIDINMGKNIRFIDFLAPPSTKVTDPINLSIKRNGYIIQYGEVTFAANPSTLTANVAMKNSLVNSQTEYLITIFLNDSLTAEGKLRITIPSSIVVTSQLNCPSLNGSEMVSEPSCNFFGNVVVISSINSSTNNIAVQNFTVTIRNLKNPSSEEPTQPFKIQTFYDSSDLTLVSVSNTVSVAAKVTSIFSTDVTVSLSSDTVVDSGQSINITLMIKNTIEQQGCIILEIPKAIGLQETAISDSCRVEINGSNFQPTVCSYLTTSDQDYWKINFTDVVLAGELAIGTSILLGIKDIVTNPISTQPTASIKLTTYDAERYKIAQLQSGEPIQVTVPATLTQAKLNRDGNTNYGTGNYNISIKQKISINQGVVVVTFPQQMEILSSTTCSLAGNSVNCDKATANQVKIQLPSGNYSGTIEMQINNVRNPPTTEPLSLLIQVKTSNEIYSYSKSSTNAIGTIQGSEFSNIAFTFSPRILVSQISLTLNITPSYQPAYMQLSIAPEFLVDALNCTSLVGFTGDCSSISSHTLRINGSFQTSPILFTVQGFRSPISTQIQSTILQSFTTQGYKIDESTVYIDFVLACDLPCRTCQGSKTSCTSCYNNTVSLNVYLYQNDHICYQVCPSGTFSNQTFCLSCDANCLTCQGNSAFCTSCNQTTDYKYLNISGSTQNCLKKCPTGMYPDSSTSITICTDCIGSCLTCSNQTYCLSCKDGSFLMNGSCSSTCIAGYVGINKECQPCSSNCKTCSNGSNSYCESCITDTYYLASAHQCRTDCGDGLFIDRLSSTCIGCTSPCKTCQNTTSTCLSCSSGVLFENNCLSFCPENTYNITNICKTCPTNCQSCNSSTFCTGCISSTYLYNNYCIAQCPATHAVVVNNSCTACTGTSCHKCTSSDVCTQCSSNTNLLNGFCLGSCPAGYQTNGTHCLDSNVIILQSSDDFPIPFTIILCILVVACLMSKLQYADTYIQGSLFALVGLLECSVLFYFCILYYIGGYSNYIPLYLGLGSLGYLYLLNILAAFVQNCLLFGDTSFRSWFAVGCNKGFFICASVFSLIGSHKFRNIIFCKLFKFRIFCAQLSDVAKFRVFNIFAFLALVGSGLAFVAAVQALSYSSKGSQFQYACIDVIVIHAANILLGFLNMAKNDQFFYETSGQGYKLNKKIYIDDDFSYAENAEAGIDAEKEEGEGYYNRITHVLESKNQFHGSDAALMDRDKRYMIGQSNHSDSLASIIQQEDQGVHEILEQKTDNNAGQQREEVENGFIVDQGEGEQAIPLHKKDQTNLAGGHQAISYPQGQSDRTSQNGQKAKGSQQKNVKSQESEFKFNQQNVIDFDQCEDELPDEQLVFEEEQMEEASKGKLPEEQAVLFTEPVQALGNYQERLAERIRSKEQQLVLMKQKIEDKEKANKIKKDGIQNRKNLAAGFSGSPERFIKRENGFEGHNYHMVQMKEALDESQASKQDNSQNQEKDFSQKEENILDEGLDERPMLSQPLRHQTVDSLHTNQRLQSEEKLASSIQQGHNESKKLQSQMKFSKNDILSENSQNGEVDPPNALRNKLENIPFDHNLENPANISDFNLSNQNGSSQNRSPMRQYDQKDIQGIFDQGKRNMELKNIIPTRELQSAKYPPLKTVHRGDPSLGLQARGKTAENTRSLQFVDPQKYQRSNEHRNKKRYDGSEGQQLELEQMRRIVPRTIKVLPMETDKQQTEFKHLGIHKISNGRLTDRRSLEARTGRPYGNSLHSRHRGNKDFERSPVRDYEQPSHPYESNDEMEQIDKLRNNIILGKLLQRPSNDALDEYYGRKGKSKNKGKGHKQQSSALKEAERIYMQRLP